jgi:septal ring factor EnvC (AmiA/AmiB activator)
MSARRLRILSLMAGQAARDIGQIGARLGQLRQQEMAQHDLAMRLDDLIAQTTAPLQTATSRAGLQSQQALAQMMLAERDRVGAELAQLAGHCRDQIAALGAQQQRKTALTDRARTTRQQIAAEQAAKAEAARPPARPNLASFLPDPS